MDGTTRTAKRLQEVWSLIRVTRHWGGVYATQELLDLLDLPAGARVLDLGCGTGYTACLLAAGGVRVVAGDLNAALLEETARRAVREGVAADVDAARLDAHRLPFADGSFDAVVSESVLAFCDRRVVLGEVFRVLRPGGVYGANEGTSRAPPSEALAAYMQAVAGVDLRTMAEADWTGAYQDAGFEDVAARVHPLRSWQELVSHLRINGARPFLRAMRHAKEVTRSVQRPRGVSTWRMVQETKHVMGYGVYVARKPG